MKVGNFVTWISQLNVMNGDKASDIRARVTYDDETLNCLTSSVARR